MQTWGELQAICTEQIGDDSTTVTRTIKRSLNIAMRKLQAEMGRHNTPKQKTADIVADQQYYQLPEDCIRVSEAWIEQDGNKYPLTEVESERQWVFMNSNAVNTFVYPQSYFVRGNDEIGIGPTPGAAITDGLVVAYESSQIPMSNDDYSTGTVTVSNGSQTVTGSGTVFTAAMVGREFKAVDDGQFYRIGAYTSSTVITLENYFDGNSISGGTYLIGETPNLPDEFHDNLADYALFRWWKTRNPGMASDFKALWDEAKILAKEQYGTKTSSAVVNAGIRTPSRNIFTDTPSAVV